MAQAAVVPTGFIGGRLVVSVLRTHRSNRARGGYRLIADMTKASAGSDSETDRLRVPWAPPTRPAFQGEPDSTGAASMGWDTCELRPASSPGGLPADRAA